MITLSQTFPMTLFLVTCSSSLKEFVWATIYAQKLKNTYNLHRQTVLMLSDKLNFSGVTTRYIYRPLVDGRWTLKYRAVGAAASFAFVCSWHGMDKAVVVWCCLNFLGISTELLAGFLSSGPVWQSFRVSVHTVTASTRLLLVLSPISPCVTRVYAITS